MIDALHRKDHPDHARAQVIARAVNRGDFARHPDNHRVLVWKNNGDIVAKEEAELANYLGLVCEPHQCASARLWQVATQTRTPEIDAPVSPAMSTLHVLCDGKPVTIGPEDWWQEGRTLGVDYTVDTTGARHWGAWKSGRFQ